MNAKWNALILSAMMLAIQVGMVLSLYLFDLLEKPTENLAKLLLVSVFAGVVVYATRDMLRAKPDSTMLWMPSFAALACFFLFFMDDMDVAVLSSTAFIAAVLIAIITACDAFELKGEEPFWPSFVILATPQYSILAVAAALLP